MPDRLAAIGMNTVARSTQNLQVVQRFVEYIVVCLVMYRQSFLWLAASFAPITSTGKALLTFLVPLRRAEIAHVFRVFCYSVVVHPSLFHVQCSVRCLIGEQGQVINRVIRFVAVNVMDNFFWIKEPAEMLLHYMAMLKNVTGAALSGVSNRMGVILRRGDENISIFTYLSSTIPAGAKFAPSAIHSVALSRHIALREKGAVLGVHWVIFARHVSMIRRIGVGKITRRSCATVRAILLICGRELPKFFAALDTGNKTTCSLKFTGTLGGTKPQSNTGEGLINLITVLARSFYHALNYTSYRLARQAWM